MVEKPAAPALEKPVETPKTAAKAVVTSKPLARQPRKERVQMEFYMHSSPNMLYELISTPSGFAEWYCQDVNVRGDLWTFIWPEEQEETTMIGRRLGEVIRFHRNSDEDETTFFEFRVRVDAMTNEVALVVTDHGWPHEVESIRNLWASQVANLMRVLGA
ncbi:MAG TPA: START-like domain-containing protein [Flavobacteriales bacterium]|nr:START-like domain-containing protein [Flavobacteriales bacterium]